MGRKTSARRARPSSTRIATSRSTRMPSQTSLRGAFILWSPPPWRAHSVIKSRNPGGVPSPFSRTPWEGGRMDIGIIGTGRMGAAIAGRLLGLGRKVAVWNRTAAKAQALAAAGATVAATPAALVRDCDLVISMLTDAAAIEAAYAGPGGALEAAAPGKLFVEMSTVRPEAEIALEARVRAEGAALVDCPVGGSVGPAKEGKLFGFVGGAEADVARARPVLEQICRRVEHVGPVGAGARMKLAINLPLLVYWQALAEALALAAP